MTPPPPRTRLTRRNFLRGSAALAAVHGLAPLNQALAAVSPAQLAADPRRPQYHLLPPANWINDPNGPIHWRGEYHMFYQYNPRAAAFGVMHWGHAVSPDMVHWRHLPIALAPTPGGPDADGCWTGSALPYGDRVALLYTGVVSAPEKDATIHNGANSLRESQCLAFASGPHLTTFTKEPAPVIPAPPAGLNVTGFRDPAPWREGEFWYTALGSGIRGQGGAVLLYRSSDLRHWDYLHPLITGAQNDIDILVAGHMWECPDFFPLGDRHVLIHSTGGKAFWQSGALDPGSLTFHPERGGILDYGSFYAPKTQLDAHHNRILWGWIQEARPEADYRAAGWAGAMSLPRILTLDAQHNLRIAVAPEVEQLRHQQQRLRITRNEAATRKQLASMTIHEACGEIIASFRRESGPFALSLVSAEKTWLTCHFDPARPTEILIDGQPIPLGPDSAPDSTPDLELRFYIDGSVIECFAGNYAAITRRVYCDGAAAPPINVKIGGSLQALTALSISQITPISRDRLTT
jgi:beta-fructofuranosidase